MPCRVVQWVLGLLAVVAIGIATPTVRGQARAPQEKPSFAISTA